MSYPPDPPERWTPETAKAVGTITGTEPPLTLSIILNGDSAEAKNHADEVGARFLEALAPSIKAMRSNAIAAMRAGDVEASELSELIIDSLVEGDKAIQALQVQLNEIAAATTHANDATDKALEADGGKLSKALLKRAGGARKRLADLVYKVNRYVPVKIVPNGSVRPPGALASVGEVTQIAAAIK